MRFLIGSVRSRDQRPYWFIDKKEIFCRKIEFSSQKTGLLLQHGTHSTPSPTPSNYSDLASGGTGSKSWIVIFFFTAFKLTIKSFYLCSVVRVRLIALLKPVTVFTMVALFQHELKNNEKIYHLLICA